MEDMQVLEVIRSQMALDDEWAESGRDLSLKLGEKVW